MRFVPDVPERGGFGAGRGFAASGFGGGSLGENAGGGSSGPGGFDCGDVGRSFSFTSMGEQLRSPTMPSALLSAPDAKAAPDGKEVPAQPRAADGISQASGGGTTSERYSNDDESLAALSDSGQRQQQPVLRQWSRRPHLTVRVPASPE